MNKGTIVLFHKGSKFDCSCTQNDISLRKIQSLSTCPAKNQAGCIEGVVHHSHENQKAYLFKIAINEKCQKPKLTVKVIMVAMATAV